MVCPHCQTAQPDPPPRFCDACGMATGLARPPKKAAAEDVQFRCNECGIVATSRRCRGCGAKIRWPEGLDPPDERPQQIAGLAPDDADAGGFTVPDADDGKEG